MSSTVPITGVFRFDPDIGLEPSQRCQPVAVMVGISFDEQSRYELLVSSSPSSHQLSQTFLLPGHAGPCPSPETGHAAQSRLLCTYLCPVLVSGLRPHEELDFLCLRANTPSGFCPRLTLSLSDLHPEVIRLSVLF